LRQRQWLEHATPHEAAEIEGMERQITHLQRQIDTLRGRIGTIRSRATSRRIYANKLAAKAYDAQQAKPIPVGTLLDEVV